MADFNFTSWKKITLDDMMKYIEEKAPTDKTWFKEIAFTDVNGNEKKTYQHLNAVRKFCKRYEEFSHLIPEKKEKEPNKSEKLKNW